MLRSNEDKQLMFFWKSLINSVGSHLYLKGNFLLFPHREIMKIIEQYYLVNILCFLL
jgi:hypothetical protein